AAKRHLEAVENPGDPKRDDNERVEAAPGQTVQPGRDIGLVDRLVRWLALRRHHDGRISEAGVNLHARSTRAGADALKRDDFSSSRRPALDYCWSMTPAFAGAGLFRKPASTFRDHTLTPVARSG